MLLGAITFLSGESKSFAGREAREKGDAIGRPIAVSWFEKHRDLAQGPFYSVLVTVGVFAPIVAAWLVLFSLVSGLRLLQAWTRSLRHS